MRKPELADYGLAAPDVERTTAADRHQQELQHKVLAWLFLVGPVYVGYRIYAAEPSLLLAAFLGFFVGGAVAFFLYLVGTGLWHAIWTRTHAQDSAILAKHRAYQTAEKNFEAQQRLARSSTTDTDRALKHILRAALHIVSEYGAVLERPPSHNAPIVNQSETQLPFSKEQITQAVHVMQHAIEHPRLRALLVQMLSPMEAQQVLSPQFKGGLESGLVLLDTFVPPSQVASERKEWQDAMAMLEKIDPQMRAQFEKSLSPAPSGEALKRETT